MPEALSVIGFDGISAGEIGMPTIYALFDEIGRAKKELELQAGPAGCPALPAALNSDAR